MHNTYFISRGELQLSNLSRIPKVQSYKVTILPHKSTDNFFSKQNHVTNQNKFAE